MPAHVLFNGELVERQRASYDLHDLGMIRGYAVFDYLRTYAGRPFCLNGYMTRLASSADQLGIRIPWSVADLSAMVRALLEANPAADGAERSVRMIISGGVTPDGFTPPSSPTLVGMVESVPVYPAEHTERGVGLITAEYMRPFPTAKTTSYIMALTLLPKWKELGAADALYVSNGAVLETTRSNFCAFFGNTLVTPRDNVLLGRTREVVLALARDAFAVEERPLSVEELSHASELFITGTTRRVTPVVTLNGAPVGRVAPDRPGANTVRLGQMFDLFAQENDELRT